MIGRTLRHHRIVQKLGAGGMGEVYLARDERLERDVAVKVLRTGALADDHARRRFRKEALALSRLNHPNIETVHEFDTEGGVDFLVMEYVAGTTLSDTLCQGPLPEQEVVRLGSQMAEALAAAHDQGIAHRDLKPGNLRVRPDGRLKVLDFGLATLLDRGDATGLATTESATELRGISGTLPYMAPEQLRGEAADHRADIWAMGVVLYEMTTGRRPFDNPVQTALVADILGSTLVSPGHLAHLSPGLEQIILKCLDRDPERRYQSARDLLADFRRLAASATDASSAGAAATLTPARSGPMAESAPTRRGKPFSRRLLVPLLLVAAVGAVVVVYQGRRPASPPPTSITSLAVLPLANLSGDPAQDYLVDGMHEALITELSKIRALRVISRTSTVRYRRSGSPLAQIAKELNVGAVVEGSVLRSGARLRVTAQLIQVEPERHLWADNFDRELTDVLILTSDVAQAVARQIRVALTPAEAADLAKARPVDPKAYELYAVGRHYWSQRTIDSYQRAIESFEKALELDSGYAPAHAALADSYMLLGEQGGLPQHEARSQAADAIRAALALDPNLAEAHASLAHWQFFYEWKWGEAEKAFTRAIELNPSYAAARLLHGRSLGFLRRFDEAQRELQRARELDPLSVIVRAYTGQVYMFAKQYDQASEHLVATIELNPNHALARHNLGELYLARGRFDDAIVELRKAVEFSERPSAHYTAMLGCAYARGSRTQEARQVLSELNARSKRGLVSTFDMASLHVALGERGPALDWLERGLAERDTWFAELQGWPWFDSLASEPRYQAVVRRLAFPPLP